MQFHASQFAILAVFITSSSASFSHDPPADGNIAIVPQELPGGVTVRSRPHSEINFVDVSDRLIPADQLNAYQKSSGNDSASSAIVKGRQDYGVIDCFPSDLGAAALIDDCQAIINSISAAQVTYYAPSDDCLEWFYGTCKGFLCNFSCGGLYADSELVANYMSTVNSACVSIGYDGELIDTTETWTIGLEYTGDELPAYAYTPPSC